MSLCIEAPRRGPDGCFVMPDSNVDRTNVGAYVYRDYGWDRHRQYEGSRDRPLLEIGEIWALVRSGMWNENGEDVEEVVSEVKRSDDSAGGSVQDTIASVVGRLVKLQGVQGKSRDEVELYHILTRNWGDNLGRSDPDYSVPELRCILEALRSLSSPWRKLPPELLIEVFSWCMPQPNTTAISSTQAPLLLCQVCSRWYELCTATPSLWTSISLDKNFLRRDETYIHAADDFEYRFRQTRLNGLGDNATNLMKKFITRSMDSPISLAVHGGVFLQPDTRKLFYDNVSRCRNLALLFPKTNPWHAPNALLSFSTLEPFDAPLLETLDIYGLRVRTPPDKPQGVEWGSIFMDLISTSASSLRQLNLNIRGETLWLKVDFAKCWGNLTHVTWGPCIPDSGLITMLCSAPNLVYASFPAVRRGQQISTITPDSSSTPDRWQNCDYRNRLQAPVVLNALETLVIGLHDMSRVFNAITLPALRHLVHLSPSNADKDAMVALIRRSGCVLETLYLYCASYESDEDLLEVLESIEADHPVSEADSGGKKRKGKGCLKALLISDSRLYHGLISDKLLERLTRRPESKGHGFVGLNENVPPGNTRDVLFPGLVYLSFYDLGVLAPGKLPTMLRSRVLSQELEQNPTGPYIYDSNPDLPPTAVAKLLMYETWHQDSDMNTMTDEDWEEMYTLREWGLLFRVFETDASRSSMSVAEKALLRRYVEDEGFVVRDYLHDIGQFGPVALEEEVRMS